MGLSRILLARILLSLAIALPFFLHVSEVTKYDWLERLEQLSYDARLRATLPNTKDPRVVIVDVDEQSLASEGQWPWSRDRLALMVDHLFDHYQVKVVAFDIAFAEPDRSSGLNSLEHLATTTLRDNTPYQNALTGLRSELDWDETFAQSLANRNTVLGYIFRPIANTPSTGALPKPLYLKNEHQTFLPYFSPQGFTGNLDRLQTAAKSGGFFDNPAVSRDGVFRRAPLLQSHEGALYESLALAALRMALDEPPLEFVFFSGDHSARDDLDLEWLKLGPYRIPVDRHASALVPYRGAQQSFPYVSAATVLDKTAVRDQLENAIVLVGTSVPGLKDLRVTPVSESFNGVEIHANLISGILDQRIKHQPRYVQGVEFVMLLIITLLMTFFVMRKKVGQALLYTTMLFAAVLGLNLYLWQMQNFVLPIAASLVLLALLYLVHTTFGYFAETRGLRAISGLFGQYVPPQLVQEMSRNPTHFTMNSESREMTVLFSDMRGFTGISENLSPQDLSALMNICLTPLTDIVYKHRGTIDKYIGDAIMAFWGAPVKDSHHASNAVRASLQMQAALADLKPIFAERGWPEIRMGIGINSGNMHVGNMGSEFRVAYTVMGDAVNLAARIEGITDHYGVGIVVGEKVTELASDCAFLELDRVQVKGKDQAVAVYEPLGSISELDANQISMIKQHDEALKRFRAQEWDSAEGLFYQLTQRYSDRKLFKIYLDRIAYFRNHAPEEDWACIKQFNEK